MVDVIRVIIDRDATTASKITKAVTPQIAPTVTTSVGTMNGSSLVDGVCKYTEVIAQTGSVVITPLFIPKPHRLMRIDLLTTVATTGALDATATTVIFKRSVNTITTNPAAAVTIFSTNGAQATDSVVIVGGNQFVEDGCEYLLLTTAAATDNINVYVYVEYL